MQQQKGESNFLKQYWTLLMVRASIASDIVNGSYLINGGPISNIRLMVSAKEFGLLFVYLSSIYTFCQ